MNEWLVATLVVLAALGPCLWVAAREEAIEGLVGLNLAGVLAPIALLLMAEGFHRQPFADLALVLALLGLAGSLAYARFLERRL
jgi:multisubunit Na+/H+ antiporter MnhF subunit